MLTVLGGNSASTGYNLTRSLRFRRSASAYLGRTFAALPTVRTKQTVSLWVKRGTLGAIQGLIAGYDGVSAFATQLYFTASDTLEFDLGGTSNQYPLITTQVFRDPSAWYHIIVSIDTTQATASDRVKLYVNGSQVTAFGTASYPAQNVLTQYAVNNANNRIGSFWNGGSTFLDGYLAEVNFIDGQALTPSSFGSTNTLTGVWQPAAYTGTYGTNGFELQFTDNSAATAAAIGKDSSGNGNNWTPNNISVTAGVTYDSMTDVPTLTSATAANFAVLNPLNAAATLNDGNMNARVTGTGGNYSVSSTIALSSGLIYFETIPYVFSLVNGQIGEFGICYATANLQAVGTRITNSGVGVGFGFGQGSSTWFSRNFGTLTNLTGLSGFTTTTVAMVAVNLTTGNMWVGKDGVWYNSGNPATGANPTITGIPTAQYAIGITAYQDAGLAVFQAVNFGQRPFTYTPPTGFVALNTYNLPTSTIVKGNTVMDATLYTGNGSTQTITNAAGFRPDLVWYKGRSTAYNNSLFDSVRGATKQLISNTTDAEATLSGVTAFNSNGFSLGSDANGNNNGTTYVGWQWQAGQGSSSSNTNGTITSTVSVNASAGFSVVTYTGNNINPSTVGHGLGVAPSLIIVKPRNTAIYNWNSYHISLGNTQFISLNTNSAASSSVSLWNNTSPTSTVFTINYVAVNTSATTHVAYCWTPIAGFSAFGSYTGNGSSDGTFVYTGFRPRWIMIKRSDSAGNNWRIWDTARATYNAGLLALFPNVSDAEDSVTDTYDLVSNGFKLRTSGVGTNASGGTYIYAAFAENPFKNSLAR